MTDLKPVYKEPVIYVAAAIWIVALFGSHASGLWWMLSICAANVCAASVFTIASIINLSRPR